MMRPEITLPPFDPQDLDRLAPADLDVCPRCCGRGIVLRYWNDDAPWDQVDDDCPACEGTGRVVA